MEPVASRLIHTSPLAPASLAQAVQVSSCLREAAPAPGTRMPRTAPPVPSAVSNTTNPDPVAAGPRSVSSSAKRVSGRSTP